MKRLCVVALLGLVVAAGIYAFRRGPNDIHAVAQRTGIAGLFVYDWAKDAEGITEITLEREFYFGMGPVYKLILRRDGSADYTGVANVSRIGKSTAKDPRLAFEFTYLARLIAHQRFLKMDDRYATSMTDQETVVTSVVHNGQRKTILNYGRTAPMELYGIEMAIDAVAARIEWEPTRQ
ncbi:MAG: DUF6438 domain-containing protein [Acidobacteriota bacterium]